MKDKNTLNEVEVWIIVKLYRRGYIGRPLDFNNIIHSKIAKRDLKKALKNLLNKNILIKKPSLKSSEGRWALNPRTKNIWENIALKEIYKNEQKTASNHSF